MIIEKVTRTKFIEVLVLDPNSDRTREESDNIYRYIDEINELYVLDIYEINERFKSSTTDEVREMIDSETENIYDLCDELRGHCFWAVVLEEVREFDGETETRILHLREGLDI